MTKEDKIKKAIDEQLTVENQELYAELLGSRIEENRKLMSKLAFIILLCVFAFPLITESKISEIALGPFKLSDNVIAMGLIPSIYAFTYYKYIAVWIDLVEQKMTLKILTATLFSIERTSFLNQKIKSFSLLDSVSDHSFVGKSKILGCLGGLFWLPISLTILFFPFIFEYYTVYTLYHKLGLESLLKKVIFFIPILFGVLTIMIIVQFIRKDSYDKKYMLK